VQSSAGRPTEYLNQSHPALPPIFSGLYGGEFLGGEFLKMGTLRFLDEIQRDAVKKHYANSHCVAKILSSADAEVSFNDNVPLKIAIVSQASISNFYNGSWFNMCSHHNLTLTPFWDSHFLMAILQQPADSLRNYTLYRKIFNFIPESLQEIPLNSEIQSHYPELPAMAEGLNPKNVRTPSIFEPVLRYDEKWLDQIPFTFERDLVDKNDLSILKKYLKTMDKLQL